MWTTGFPVSNRDIPCSPRVMRTARALQPPQEHPADPEQVRLAPDGKSGGGCRLVVIRGHDRDPLEQRQMLDLGIDRHHAVVPRRQAPAPRRTSPGLTRPLA